MTDSKTNKTFEVEGTPGGAYDKTPDRGVSIGEIYNHYGNLNVRKKDGVCQWAIDDYDALRWETIPEPLYRALLAFKEGQDIPSVTEAECQQREMKVAIRVRNACAESVRDGGWYQNTPDVDWDITNEQVAYSATEVLETDIAACLTASAEVPEQPDDALSARVKGGFNMLKSVVNEKEFPFEIHVQSAVVMFPDGVKSGNWQTKREDDTEPYFRLSASHHDEIARLSARVAELEGALAPLLSTAKILATDAQAKSLKYRNRSLQNTEWFRDCQRDIQRAHAALNKEPSDG